MMKEARQFLLVSEIVTRHMEAIPGADVISQAAAC
jgi:hypothetical protein